MPRWYGCDGETCQAGPGDLVLLPVGLPHTVLVGPPESGSSA